MTIPKISDDVRWGKLVKSWATGKNYFNAADPPFPIPRTLDELLQTAKSVGVTLTFPAEMVGLAVIQYSAQTAVVKLPPKALVEATETTLQQTGATYPIPKFYDDFYARQLPAMTTARLLDLHAARIGDYSIRNCG